MITNQKIELYVTQRLLIFYELSSLVDFFLPDFLYIVETHIVLNVEQHQYNLACGVVAVS